MLQTLTGARPAPGTLAAVGILRGSGCWERTHVKASSGGSGRTWWHEPVIPGPPGRLKHEGSQFEGSYPAKTYPKTKLKQTTKPTKFSGS